jgi:hypothetical protein
MSKKVAIGLLAAILYAAPLQAAPANPVAPAITKPNNDASLRAPHTAPARRLIRTRPSQPNKSP